jgi:hypothetical protein
LINKRADKMIITLIKEETTEEYNKKNEKNMEVLKN